MDPTPTPAGGAKRVPVAPRFVLYALTVLSAFAALFLEPALAGAVKRGALTARWLFLPMVVYGVFLSVFLVDRVRLVRVRRLPAGRAFFQGVVAVAVAFLLLPSTIEDYQAGRARPGGLLAHPDPEVRAAAVYAQGFEGASRERAHQLSSRLDDPSPVVRRAAARVLGRWAGRSPEDLAGIRAWLLASSSTAAAGR